MNFLRNQKKGNIFIRMKQNVALVLSGGGARGIAHIGVIEELERQNFEITSIAGTSMGSLVGGVYALGKIEVFKNWICTLDKRKVFSLVDFALSKQGMIKGDRVLKKMKDFIPDTNIEELSIPYVAVAADLLHREEIAFSEGSIYEAIRASISPIQSLTNLFLSYLLSLYTKLHFLLSILFRVLLYLLTDYGDNQALYRHPNLIFHQYKNIPLFVT